MSFLEVRFPLTVAYGTAGGPGFQTEVVTLGSGYEQRNIKWTAARAKYDAATGVHDLVDLQDLIAFFNVCRGMAHSFRWKDFSNFAATLETIGTGDGADTTFQLIKTDTYGGLPYVRTISKPVAATTHIYVTGPAVGTITLTGVPALDETFVIGSQTFTWKAARASAGQVTRGGTAAACVTNIVTAITADIPTVATAVDGAGDTVVVTAVTPGVAGNSLTFTEACGSFTMDGGGHLGGTTAGYAETEAVAGWVVDTTTGVVTFTPAPLNHAMIRASFEFDVPARFDTDSISVVLDDYLVGSAQVPIVEVRV